jgi:hypothetical protein
MILNSRQFSIGYTGICIGLEFLFFFCSVLLIGQIYMSSNYFFCLTTFVSPSGLIFTSTSTQAEAALRKGWLQSFVVGGDTTVSRETANSADRVESLWVGRTTHNQIRQRFERGCRGFEKDPWKWFSPKR